MSNLLFEVLGSGDFENLVMWVQPVLWAMLLGVKSRVLDRLLFIGVTLGLSMGVVVMAVWPFQLLFLFLFFGFLGYGFSLFLWRRGWRYTEAIAVAALCCFVGGFLWEVPYLIRNAFITGFQWDWLLHLLRLYFVAFLSGYWLVTKRGVALIAFALLVSVFAIAISPLPPGHATEIYNWNSPIYMICRLVSTLVVFTLIHRPAEVNKIG